ncbi:MaoC family dehydratase [Microbacterium sp. Se63.02b]|uniref:MaoC family dehydratase n=1 Tax=Microbacterium sp. Se63.02b TaxID=2709304 RepID=UPI001FCE9E0A|nr:MaoC family dehydratase [Microbacterium sp. Se63.02b]
MPTTFAVDDLDHAVGSPLGVSPWRTVDQERIARFALATDDDQWIHTDPVRAAQGPFGSAVAHGLLTLSLLPAMAAEVYTVTGAAGRVNYGYERVRFPAPVRAGEPRARPHRPRCRRPSARSGAPASDAHGRDRRGQRPACVAQSITQFVLDAA